MDFLKGLQEALAMGLTKEQYIDVWKTDKLAQGLSPDRDYLLTTRPQMENAEAKATSVDHNGGPSSLDLQRVNQCNDHFLSNFRYMCNQLAENEEQQRKQFQQKHDQMMEEVRARFNLLSDHISNVTDCNTNSLKVYVMQELGLFQQELRQMIHEGGIKQGCDPDGNKISTAVQGLASAEIPEGRWSGTLSNRDELEKDGQWEQSGMQEMRGTVSQQAAASELAVYQQHTINNGVPVYTDRLKKGAQNTTPLMDVKFTNGKVDLNTIDVDASRNLRTLPLVTSGVNRKSAQYLNVEIAETKMPYAKSIDTQKKHSSTMNSAGSQALSGSSTSLNSAKGNTDMPNLTVSKLPIGSQVFSVTLNEQNGGFLSPVMHSSGVPIKAKFRGRFDVEGRLNVFIHVRSTGYDGIWPLELCSTGEVYHSASKRYTHVWQLLPTVFQKPDSADEEYTIKCEVSLITSRGKYPNVTYKQLVLSHYIENSTLTMRCTLRARTDV